MGQSSRERRQASARTALFPGSNNSSGRHHSKRQPKESRRWSEVPVPAAAMAASDYNVPTSPTFSSSGRPGRAKSTHSAPSQYHKSGGGRGNGELQSPRTPRRGTSIRSAGGRGLDNHSFHFLQVQIQRLARTCDVDFLERMVPAQGPKDSADKEAELLRRLMRHIEETRADRKWPAAAINPSSPGAAAPEVWDGGAAGGPAADVDADRLSNHMSLSSASGSIPSAAAVSDESRTGIEQSLLAILRELKRCANSPCLVPSLKDRIFLRVSSKHQNSKEFTKTVKRNIKMVEGMLPEAVDLAHDDLALWLNYSSDSLEREISHPLNRGGKPSEIPWDMLQLQLTSLMADVRSKWELAAEARKSFVSFGEICVARYHAQRKTQVEMDKLSERSRRDSDGQSTVGSRPQDDAWRDFQKVQRAASTRRHHSSGSSAGGGGGGGLSSSSRSLSGSFYRESIHQGGSSDSPHDQYYTAPSSRQGSSSSTQTVRAGHYGGGSSFDEQMSVQIARLGGDRAANMDLVSRIRAFNAPPLTHIREED